jgi:hypothetical protein
MSVAVMLRLAPEALAEGRLAGEAELVTTGERTLVASAEQLVSFLSSRIEATAPSRPPEERQ